MTITKRNGKYYCRFQINGERHHYLCNGATNKAEAEKMENAFKYKLMQQQNGVIPREENIKGISLKKLMLLYIDYNKANNKQREPKEKTKAFYEFFGESININKIKAKDIEDLRMWLMDNKKLSNSTINRYISCLSKAYNLAIDNNIIEANPCSRIKFLKEPKETIKFYTLEEEETLLTTVMKYRPDFLGFVTCAFQTGLRVSNIQYMRWEQINLKDRIIEIQPQDNKGRKLIRLYISDRLLEVLSKNEKRSGYVFINPECNNVYLTPNRILSKICKKCKLKHIGFHGIRHTVATRLIKAGVPINVAQAVLAHSDIRTTMKYVHLQDNSIKEAISVLNSYN